MDSFPSLWIVLHLCGHFPISVDRSPSLWTDLHLGGQLWLFHIHIYSMSIQTISSSLWTILHICLYGNFLLLGPFFVLYNFPSAWITFCIHVGIFHSSPCLSFAELSFFKGWCTAVLYHVMLESRPSSRSLPSSAFPPYYTFSQHHGTYLEIFSFRERPFNPAPPPPLVNFSGMGSP